MIKKRRKSVGFWIESPRGAQWANQGMTRLVGFLIEGAALEGDICFRVVVTDDIRDQAEEDLATLSATRDLDYSIHSPRDAGVIAPTFADLAEFANLHVDVEAWISIFPNQVDARYLRAPVTTIFPDAIGLVYHDFHDSAWNEHGHAVAWRNKVSDHLKKTRRVITFSEHVARDQVSGIFGVERNRISVIPHAPPSLEGILPFLPKQGRTEESLFRAASILRRFAAKRGWYYLADFPFEHARYAAISTQDRVTKNIQIVADAIERIIRGHGQSFKAFMTAAMNFNRPATQLTGMVQWSQLNLDIISMPDLPRDVHAAFCHCAEVAVHPSVFEGGRGVFPYYEAISVGTPCLMANGPHVAEFLEEVPEMTPYVFDANDADALAELILDTSSNRAEVVRHQTETYRRLRRRTWNRVAKEYVDAALFSEPESEPKPKRRASKDSAGTKEGQVK